MSLNNLKAKYKLLRTQKLQEKLKALGIEVQDDEDRAALLEKEKRLLFEKSEILIGFINFLIQSNAKCDWVCHARAKNIPP